MGESGEVDPGQLRAAGYAGYSTRLSSEPDRELTEVSRGAPCGEYLRRFWHPVALAAEVRDLPLAVRILGEDLVLFRKRGGRLGLVHRRCPHRQASLEFGTTSERGIRCCYHGWLFDVDGRLLEAPGQPPGAARRLCAGVRLGAYPVFERRGLVFAYLGPPEVLPEFPVYDTLALAGLERVPYRAPFACNWLQVLDAIVDPIHTAFLHSNISRAQFSEGFGVVGQMAFFERGAWLLGVAARRVGDNAWLRINELVLPNFTQAGAAFATDGSARRVYGRSAFSRWVVPVDDTHTLAFAWANFGARGDPPAWNTPEGPELIEQGEVFARSYEQRQRFPADAEAVEGMGPVTVHANEHLAPSDKGVALMRRLLRRQIRAVAGGEAPLRATDPGHHPVPTYGGDSVLHIPPSPADDDAALLCALANEFVEAQFACDGLSETERVNRVSARLEAMEARGAAPPQPA